MLDDFIENVVSSFDSESAQGSHRSRELVTIKDFLFDPNRPDCVLTTTQKAAFKRYKKKFPQALVVDVNQNPSHRPRWGINSCPTLTTNCAKMLYVPSCQTFSLTLRFFDQLF